AAAADVEEAQALEGPRLTRVAPETLRYLVADIGKAHRIELVQRAEFAIRVPPFGGECGKAFHFRGVDRRSLLFRSSWLLHRIVSSIGHRKSGVAGGMSRQQFPGRLQDFCCLRSHGLLVKEAAIVRRLDI